MIPERLKSAGKFAGGIVLILVGIFGLVMPILPGFVLIYFGLELLGFGLVIREIIHKYRTKYWKD